MMNKNKELDNIELATIVIRLLALWLCMPPILPQENKENLEVKKDDE